MMGTRVKRLAPALILVVAAVALYRKAIRLWWTFDDPRNLHAALTDTGTFAHELQLRLFGLDATRWYGAQLALLVLTVIAVYVALRLFVDWVPALCGAVLFLAGPPLCVAATQLMTMQALLSVFVCAIAVTLYVLAFRRQSFLFEALSAIAYFVAMLAHVLTLPLPLLLLCIPDKPLRVRVRHSLFHAIALIVFIAWQRPTFTNGARALPQTIVDAFAGDGLFFGLIALAVLAIGVVIALRSRRGLAIALAGIAVALLPVIGGTKELFVPWLWIVATFTFGASQLKISPRIALFVVALATVVVANRQEWGSEYGRAKRMSDEARTFIELDGASLLRKPSIPPATMAELRWLKETHLHKALGTGWFYDDLFLCGRNLRGRRVYEYLEARKEVVEVTARIPDFASAYCASIRDDAPLRAEFHHRNDTLFWRLGPYADGRWSVLLDEGAEAFVVPREDGFRFANVPGVSLRIRYDSPEGWVTYSPEIALDFTRQPDFTWHR